MYVLSLLVVCIMLFLIRLSTYLIMLLLRINCWLVMLKVNYLDLNMSFYMMISLLILKFWKSCVLYLTIFMVSLRKVCWKLWFFLTFPWYFYEISWWILPLKKKKKLCALWVIKLNFLLWNMNFHLLVNLWKFFLKHQWFSILPFVFQGILVLDEFWKQKRSLLSKV